GDRGGSQSARREPEVSRQRGFPRDAETVGIDGAETGNQVIPSCRVGVRGLEAEDGGARADYVAGLTSRRARLAVNVVVSASDVVKGSISGGSGQAIKRGINVAQAGASGSEILIEQGNDAGKDTRL